MGLLLSACVHDPPSMCIDRENVISSEEGGKYICFGLQERVLASQLCLPSSVTRIGSFHATSNKDCYM